MPCVTVGCFGVTFVLPAVESSCVVFDVVCRQENLGYYIAGGSSSWSGFTKIFHCIYNETTNEQRTNNNGCILLVAYKSQ